MISRSRYGAPEFPETTARRETVSVILRKVKERSILVTDGTRKTYTDYQGRKRVNEEKWEVLPRSMAEIEGVDMDDTDALEALVGKEVEITAPEWILKDRGLI
jgi:hypothetical protein